MQTMKALGSINDRLKAVESNAGGDQGVQRGIDARISALEAGARTAALTAAKGASCGTCLVSESKQLGVRVRETAQSMCTEFLIHTHIF